MAAVTLDSKTTSPRRADAQPTPIRANRRSGLTLVEMMVSVTITLLVVFAIVQVFDIMGQTVAMGRATIEMAGQLRSVTNTLQRDLDNLTCPVEPWIDPDAGLGYFEYIEGRRPIGSTINAGSDADHDADGIIDTMVANAPSHFGDLDDALFFTVRSPDEPFRGKFSYYRRTLDGMVEPEPYRADGTLKPSVNSTPEVIQIESNVAEIAWWVGIDSNGARSLYRRVLLVMPSLNGSTAPAGGNLPADIVSGPATPPTTTPATNITPAYLRSFYEDNDVSVRVISNDGGFATGLSANTLGSLSSPRNRFAHYAANQSTFDTPNTRIDMDNVFEALPVSWTFPVDGRYFVDNSRTNSTDDTAAPFVLKSNREGEDIVLSDTTAFDVRVYDPDAPIYAVGDVSIAPSDPGWSIGGTAIGFGAFADLGYAPGQSDLSALSADPIVNANAFWLSYDTWSLEFERDGIDQDSYEGADQGFDGTDNPDKERMEDGYPVAEWQINGIDDLGERETRPPYNVPLSGIEVRIRMLEFGTGQVRQASVVGDFSN